MHRLLKYDLNELANREIRRLKALGDPKRIGDRWNRDAKIERLIAFVDHGDWTDRR